MGNHNSGRRGVPPEIVARVKQLIAAGLSGRKIADQLGIDPKTVRKILASEARLRSRRRQRCICGFITERPCRVCQAMQHCEAAKRKRTG